MLAIEICNLYVAFTIDLVIELNSKYRLQP